MFPSRALRQSQAFAETNVPGSISAQMCDCCAYLMCRALVAKLDLNQHHRMFP